MTVTRTDQAWQREFVRAHTSLQRPRYVPEVRLHLADDMTLLWQRAEESLGRPGLEPPYWASAWAGGQAVARYLLDRPEVVAGRPVLDVASGSGLCAIAAALAGASSVTASDIDDVSVAAIEVNAAANGVAVRAERRDVLETAPVADGVVMAGDVCYESGMTSRVLSWLAACRARGATALLGDPGRAFLPRDGLVELARYEIVGDPMLENAGVRHASVYAVGPARP